MPDSISNPDSEIWARYARLLRSAVSPERLSITTQLAETFFDQSRGEKERAHALVRYIQEVNRITETQYAGHTLAEDPDFIEQRRLANELFADLDFIYTGTSESALRRFFEGAEDEDYVGTLWQATKAASSYNLVVSNLDFHLRSWFVLGFYSSAYELACKVIAKLVQNLLATGNLSCGDARQQLQERLSRYSTIADNLDNFLRNAINHVQYIFNDQTGLVDAWNVRDGVKTPKRSYQPNDIFHKTVSLLFLIVALYVVYNEQLEAFLIRQYGVTTS